jgi:MYXO-CTERM domain-containing protein
MHQTPTFRFQGAAALLAVVALVAAPVHAGPKLPERPKRPTIANHTNQDEVPPPPMPPWSHTNQDNVLPPDPGIDNRAPAPPLPLGIDTITGESFLSDGLSRLSMLVPVDPVLDDVDHAIRIPPSSAPVRRPSLFDSRSFGAFDPDPRLDEKGLGIPRVYELLRPRDTATWNDQGLLDLPALPGPTSGRPLEISTIPAPGALGLLGLGALTLLGGRRRRRPAA